MEYTPDQSRQNLPCKKCKQGKEYEVVEQQNRALNKSFMK